MMSATLSLRTKYGLAIRRVIAPKAGGDEPALPLYGGRRCCAGELGRVDGTGLC